MSYAIFIFTKKEGKQLAIANANFISGCCENELKKYDKAISLLKESLILRKEILGNNNHDVVENLHRLGTVYANKLEFKLAVAPLKESLHILVTMIGPKQLGIADILLDLGQVLYSLNRLDETFFSYAEALEIFRIHYGNKHLKVAKCLGLLGCLCDDKKEISECIQYFEEAINVYNFCLDKKNLKGLFIDQVIKDGCLSWASTVYNLATVQERQGQIEKAGKSYTSKLIKLFVLSKFEFSLSAYLS